VAYARAVAGRLLLVLSCGALALAMNELLLQWVLTTDAYMQRFLFGG
jgi:hypothetical protein